MSSLYDAVRRLEEYLKQSGKSDKECTQIKGQISIQAKVMLVGINEHTPEDPAKLAALRAAVQAVLGRELL